MKGGHPSTGSPKSQGGKCTGHTPSPQGEARSLGYPPDYMSCVGVSWGIWWEGILAFLPVGIFSVIPCEFLNFSQGGITSCVARHLLCLWEEINSGPPVSPSWSGILTKCLLTEWAIWDEELGSGLKDWTYFNYQENPSVQHLSF